MKIKPVGHQLLVRIDDVQNMSAGGIALPDEHIKREKGGNVSGTVKAVGSLAFADFDHDLCGVGDKIVMERYAGYVPRLQGLTEDQAQNWRLVVDTEVRAVVSEDGVDLND